MTQGNMDTLAYVRRNPHEAADEIERLRADLQRGIDDYTTLNTMFHSLRAENEQLRAEYQRIAANHDLMHEQRDDAVREIEQLRAALEKIAYYDDFLDSEVAASMMNEARAALKRDSGLGDGTHGQ